MQFQGGTALSPGDIDVTKKPENWRERMRQRQKFWSHSTGFKFGRKLADWGKDEGKGQPRPSAEAEIKRGKSEDEDIQRAIALSLGEYEGGSALDD